MWSGGSLDRYVDPVAKFTSYEATITLKSCKYLCDTHLAVLRSSNSNLAIF